MLNKILAIVGPTASGKTALSVNLAKKYNAEIISCDSMQLYKGMDIGTAKPSVQEMDGVVHHLIDILSIDTPFSVSDYVQMAQKAYIDITSRSKTALFCGGTGLYIDSFISGVDFGDYDISDDIKKQLSLELEHKGELEMYNTLLEIDPVSALKTCPQNIKRVLRALEVFYSTGITLTEWNKRSLENAKPKNALIIGLDYIDRELLYSRIDKRVDIMVRYGLLEETKELINKGLKQSPTASQAIGYKEFYAYFDGQASLDECIEALKRNSRRYAKRQLTWFRRNPNIKWIYRDNITDKEITELACGLVDKYISEEEI